jgi:hypothetical protein
MRKLYFVVVALLAVSSITMSIYTLNEVHYVNHQARMEVQINEYESLLSSLKQVGVFDELNQSDEGRLLRESIIKTADNCVGRGYEIGSGEVGTCIAAIKLSKLIN